MFYIVLTYSIYLVLTILLTIWVARTLFNNGKIFLVDIFHGNEALAQSVNRLLIVGFYLLNIGYIMLNLEIWNEVLNYRMVFEILSKKVGGIVLILGVVHLLNLFVFFKLRQRAKNPKLKTSPVNHPPQPPRFQG